MNDYENLEMSRDMWRHRAEQTERVAGKLLRLARERSGKTMGDLSRFLSISVTAVSDAERGRAALTVDQMEKAVEWLRGSRELLNGGN